MTTADETPSSPPPMPRPDKGRNWLRYREQGIELEIDFDTPEACVTAMDSLARLLEQRLATRKGAPVAPTIAPAPATPAMVPPANKGEATAQPATLPAAPLEPMPAAEPATPPPSKLRQRNTAEFYAERKRQVLDYITKYGTVSPGFIFRDLGHLFYRAAECGTMLSDWIRLPDCPIERIGYGHYRLKKTQLEAAAP